MREFSHERATTGDVMLLAIDVGNTNTKPALYSADGETLLDQWRVSSLRERMPDEWFAILSTLFGSRGFQTNDVSAVVISSVVPGITAWLVEMCRRRFGIEALLLLSTQDLGLFISTDHPAETGIDRIMNGLAAHHRYGGPILVVDCGTATKFDVVTATGSFIGGAIAPGLRISLDALASRAARLYAVSLDVPERAIGTSTITSVQSGVVLGYIAMCEGMISRIVREMGGAATVVGTGGAAAMVRASIPAMTEFEPDLTLEGIRLAWKRLRR